MAIAPPIDITPRTEREKVTALPYDIDAYARVAKMARGSSYYSHSIEDATIILLTGAELGLKPMQALRSINVIKGKPHMSADLMGAIATSHPSCRMWKVEMSQERASVTVLRDGWDAPVVYEYTVADAKTAGLWGNRGPWSQHPASMLKARCVAMAARAAFPDALLGVYVEEHGEAEVSPERPVLLNVDMSSATMLESAPGARARLTSEVMGKTRDDEPAVSVSDLTALLASAEGVTDDLRREWCAWLCKQVGVGKLAEIPAPKLTAFVGRLATMDPAERGARMRENLGIDDSTPEQLASEIATLVGECVDAEFAERVLKHLRDGRGVEDLATLERDELLKMRNDLRGREVTARGEWLEANLGEWDAARKAFFAEIDGALKNYTGAARTRLKKGYKAHVVGERPSLHAMSPEQIRGEADLLKGLGAEASKHIEQHAVKPPASEVF